MIEISIKLLGKIREITTSDISLWRILPIWNHCVAASIQLGLACLPAGWQAAAVRLGHSGLTGWAEQPGKFETIFFIVSLMNEYPSYVIDTSYTLNFVRKF